MKKVTDTIFTDDIFDIINAHLKKDDVGKQPLSEILNNHLDQFTYTNRCVLGLDIFKYSQYEERKQLLIPVLLRLLFNFTAMGCFTFEKYVFQNIIDPDFKNDHSMKVINNNITKPFLENFIDTGDGGFFIFETPIHAITFLYYLSGVIHAYNSYLIIPELREMIGELTVRYSITYGNVYILKNKTNFKIDNFYGRALINCSRIIAKDKLNRLLIDQNTHEWFLRHIQGELNLTGIKIENLFAMDCFSQYKKIPESLTSPASLVFFNKNKNHNTLKSKVENNFKSIDILDIGTITQKNDSLRVYNLHIKCLGAFISDLSDKSSELKYVNYSIGNLNTNDLA